MNYSIPVTDLVQRRCSCCIYPRQPLDRSQIESINTLLSEIHSGPLGSALRFTPYRRIS